MNRRKFLTTVGGTMLAAESLSSRDASIAATNPATLSMPPSLLDLLSLEDIEKAAERILPPALHDYIAGGAADELTIRRNWEKYRELLLQPKALIDVSKLDCSTNLFGQHLSLPILLAPIGNLGMAHPEKEIATARGAGLAGVTMVLSSGSNTSIEDVVRAASQPVWFQLYVAQDRTLARDLVQRVEAAGAKALCVTVDSPTDGSRNRQNRAKLVIPRDIKYPHYVGIKEPPSLITLDLVRPAKLEWRDMEWLRSLTKLPMLLKGVINPLDAEHAIKIGADGIIVSNHGGRCLDTQPATIEALPRIVARVQGRVPLLVDGGIRRGTDVIKAIALGASAVLIGRPHAYGLAVGGAEGVAHTVKILRQELLLGMSLLGCPNLKAIDRSVLWD